MAGATITPDKRFTDLDFEAFQDVVDLNFHGTVLPSLVFSPALIESGGSIINFSSVSAPLAVTRVVGYSAAKSAVENFTRWLSVELAGKTEGHVRVNAVLPGFYISEQNRRLLTNEDGSYTERGELVIQNTPFGRVEFICFRVELGTKFLRLQLQIWQTANKSKTSSKQ